MARSTPGVTITGIDVLSRSIQEHDRKVKRVIAAELLYAKEEAVGFAKANAPWTDRTGNARAGLHGDVRFGPEQNFFAELILAHSVFYGIWLEVRWSGKYAILMPTINFMGPLIMHRLASAIARLGAMA